MDTITTIIDTIDKKWIIEDSLLSHNLIHLQIKIISNESLSNLRFDYRLSDDSNNVIDSGSYPKERTQYIQTDQEILEEIMISCRSGRNYKLYLIAVNGFDFFEYTYNFSSPLPTKNFPSWIWDETLDSWVPPIPMPEGITPNDGYIWSEKDLTWIKS